MRHADEQRDAATATHEDCGLIFSASARDLASADWYCQ